MCGISISKKFRGENDKLAKNLNNFRKSMKFCDYILKTTTGDEFPVHRNVIAARSSFFEAKFNNPLYADSDSSVSELQKVSSEVLGKIIEFMYSAQTTIHSDYAKEMLDTALFLGLNDLVDACTEVLIKTINLKTCVDLLNYSETYHRGDKLENTCLQYILKNMNAVIETPDFVKISSDSTKKMISIDRNGCSEETLFSAVVKWISFDLEEREEFIKPLLDFVHFDKLSNRFCLTNVFENNPLLDNPYFLKKIVDIQRKNCETFVNNGNEEKPIAIFKSDVISKGVFAIFNGGLRQFNQDKFSESITTINQVDFGYSVIHTHDIFVCGGYSYFEAINSCQYFSFNEYSWKELSPMKVARYLHRSIWINDRIYACGGWNMNSVESFDLNKNCWMDGPSLPKSMDFFGLCALNNCIYLTYEQSVHCLDPRENSWRTLSTSLSSEKSWCSSVGFENFIYRFEDGNILKFDLRNNKWNDGEKKNYGIRYLQTPHVCKIGDEIYVIGYYKDSDKKSKHLLQKYDASNMNLLKKHHMDAQSNSSVQALFSVE